VTQAKAGSSSDPHLDGDALAKVDGLFGQSPWKAKDETGDGDSMAVNPSEAGLSTEKQAAVAKPITHSMATTEQLLKTRESKTLPCDYEEFVTREEKPATPSASNEAAKSDSGKSGHSEYVKVEAVQNWQ